MTLTADERRALALPANADRNGATRQLLAVHGFGVPMVGLINEGFATLTREQVKVGAKEVGRVRITDAGRAAVRAAEG